MAKSASPQRLTLHLSDDLRAWVDLQAEEVGLDAASWIKMQLTKAMRGKSNVSDIPALQLIGAAEPYDERGERTAYSPLASVDPAALDALVEQGLAAADAQGLTAPVESPDDGPQADTVRVGEPSRATMRNLVGNGTARPW